VVMTRYRTTMEDLETQGLDHITKGVESAGGLASL
jgi:hypothetical protein